MVSLRVTSIGVVNPEPLVEGTTIYQCYQNGRLVYSPNTEAAALMYLSDNGGGVYKNVLHHFQFEVKPDEYRNLVP